MPFTWKMKARYLLRDSPAWDFFWTMRSKKQQAAWEQGGRLGPPHIIKQRILLEYAKDFHLDTLVETGTFLGDMIYAMKDRFKEIYSIELSDELHAKAKESFRKYPHIHLIAGDSSQALAHVLSKITGRCLFWLDGHYSGGITAMGDVRCPIRGELEAIMQHPVKDHVILIDDVQCFDGNYGYPMLSELHEMVLQHFPGYEMQVIDNVIQIRPAGRKQRLAD